MTGPAQAFSVFPPSLFCITWGWEVGVDPRGLLGLDAFLFTNLISAAFPSDTTLCCVSVSLLNSFNAR